VQEWRSVTAGVQREKPALSSSIPPFLNSSIPQF
jgi:hypothetical protein